VIDPPAPQGTQERDGDVTTNQSKRPVGGWMMPMMKDDDDRIKTPVDLSD
jgi:hypothetical protein